MSQFEVQTPDFENRVRESFSRQGIMATLGAKLLSVQPGKVRIELPFNKGLTQQLGYLHAGTLTTIVDNACGYAALTLLPMEIEVLAIELKINFLSPAIGEKIVACGSVAKSGKNISVCKGEVFDYREGQEKLVAIMQSTVMAVRSR